MDRKHVIARWENNIRRRQPTEVRSRSVRAELYWHHIRPHKEVAMRGWTLLWIVAILALVTNVASAHHPFSAHYDATKSGMITGKIAAVQWTNPHVVLALDVESDGKTERWMIEGYPPNTLRRQGWDKDSLREGDRVTVSGWPARDAALKIFRGLEVTFENGSTRVFGGGPSDLWQCSTGDCPTAKWIPTIVK